MKKCLAIIAYDRSEYLVQCLQSIQDNGSDIDKFIFIDGGDESMAKNVETKFWVQMMELGYTVIIQPFNLGVGHHTFFVRDYLTMLGYDYFIIVEEDVVVSPNFIDVTCNLAEWAFLNFDDIGVVTTWNMCKERREWKEKHLYEVEVSNCNWITYAMHRYCWMEIRPYLQIYLDNFIIPGNYKNRAHGEIRKWYMEVFGTPPEAMEGELFPEVEGYFWPYGHIMTGKWPSSQDGCVVGAMGKVRLRKIATRVNRCKYIGKVGQHGTPSQFVNAGFADVEIDTFEGEREVKTFLPRGE